VTVDANEKARYTGAPVECFRFAIGVTIYRYTSADQTITASLDGGMEEYAKEAIERGDLDYSQEDGAGNLDISVPILNPVAQSMLIEGPTQAVTVTVYRFHFADSSSVVEFIGRVVGAVYEAGACTLKCAPLDVSLQRLVPRLYVQSECNWALYGAGCEVAKASFKDSGTVMTFAGYQVRAAIFATRADGWYVGGWMELADGTRRYITAHVATAITLRSPFPVLAIGQTFDAYAGCDRTEATCLSKFNNLGKHFGFKRIPIKNPYTEGMV